MEYVQLLEEVILDRLDVALDDREPEESKKAFKEAMEAIDRKIQIEKINVSKLELENKEKLEESKFNKSKEEQRKNDILKLIEIVAVPVGLLMLDYAFKRSFMKTVCNFEKDYTFTTTPGKSISQLFKFKK